MKKVVTLLLAAVMVLGMAFTAFAEEGVAAAGEVDIDSIEPITIIATSTRGEQIETAYIAFLERVKERSGGKIDYEFYGSGSLVSAQETVDALLDGRCDIANINIANFENLFPMTANVVSIPFMGMTRAGAEVFGEVCDKFPSLLEKEITGNGLHLLSYNMTPAVNLHINASGEVRTPADIAGKKIIGMSAMMLKIIEAYGAAPLQVAFPDCYQSLQGGVADGIFQNGGPVATMGLYEVAKQSVIFQENGGIYFDVSIHCVSEDFWNSLSPAAQLILTEEGMTLHKEEQEVRFGDMDLFDKVVGESPDNTIVTLTPEEVAVWKEAAQPVIDAKIEEIAAMPNCEEFKDAYEYALSIMK
ncbi:MAG: TRAP transporter substrate-binding protein DctP [Parasporobacterium sp.]|nr:TRAP transporter substrate-binding protein DctP [Parasporobacterium sp.]